MKKIILSASLLATVLISCKKEATTESVISATVPSSFKQKVLIEEFLVKLIFN